MFLLSISLENIGIILVLFSDKKDQSVPLSKAQITNAT